MSAQSSHKKTGFDSVLTSNQHKNLTLLCNTFIANLPEQDNSDFWAVEATDLPVIERIEGWLAVAPEKSRNDLKLLLSLCNVGFIGLLTLGKWASLGKMSFIERESLLKKWANSRIPQLRGAFASLKQLTGFAFLGHSDAQNSNPVWIQMGYQGPEEKVAPVQEILPTKKLNADKVISCEVLVIGSGAGGGVAAAVLAQNGKEVLVVEKGPYLPSHLVNQKEVEMIGKLYDRKGTFASDDSSVSIYAGSGLGGGTTVNWAGSFRTPDYVLDEWAKEHGNPQFIDPEYQKYFEIIEKRCAVNTELSVHNPQNSKLEHGAKKLNYKVNLIPRNVKKQCENVDESGYCASCGYGLLGNKYSCKQGTVQTFLKDAVDHGAKLMVNTSIEKLTFAQGSVTGALGTQIGENGQRFAVHIKADKVVVAAGALHSPALLMRSGLQHPELGKNLYLHPVMPVMGIYDEEMHPSQGPMMSAVVDEFTRLDGNFGFKIETPPFHPGMMGVFWPWFSAKQFKTDWLSYKKVGVFFPLVRDKFGGKIYLDKKGNTIAHYRLSKYDTNHVIRGLQECAKLHFAAGARELVVPHFQSRKFNRETDQLDDFIQHIAELNYAPNRHNLASAHQMGTCRMGGRKNEYPFQPTGEHWQMKNLYIADASAFPKCSGANPMESIQALAYYVAKGMI